MRSILIILLAGLSASIFFAGAILSKPCMPESIYFDEFLATGEKSYTSNKPAYYRHLSSSNLYIMKEYDNALYMLFQLITQEFYNAFFNFLPEAFIVFNRHDCQKYLAVPIAESLKHIDLYPLSEHIDAIQLSRLMAFCLLVADWDIQGNIFLDAKSDKILYKIDFDESLLFSKKEISLYTVFDYFCVLLKQHESKDLLLDALIFLMKINENQIDSLVAEGCLNIKKYFKDSDIQSIFKAMKETKYCKDFYPCRLDYPQDAELFCNHIQKYLSKRLQTIKEMYSKLKELSFSEFSQYVSQCALHMSPYTTDKPFKYIETSVESEEM